MNAPSQPQDQVYVPCNNPAGNLALNRYTLSTLPKQKANTLAFRELHQLEPCKQVRTTGTR